MTRADLVLTGAVRTLDPARPTAEALAVADGKVLAVGSRDDVSRLAGPRTRRVALDPRWCVLPGFVEPHGHPVNEALVLATMLDIRPVTLPDADGVVDALRRAAATAGPDGVYANGWDPILQRGLPTADRRWLDAVAPDVPLVVVHNSGHAVYFNSAAAAAAGVDRSTPDPVGSRYERDADGELTGVGVEAGCVFALVAPLLARAPELPELLAQETRRLNAAGVTTCSEMAWDPRHAAGLQAAREAGALTARLRLYEMSGPAGPRPASVKADALVRQVGIKTWADGTPWVGNIATSFPYLDTPTTRRMGLAPGHRGSMNYSREQLQAVMEAYHEAGWQLSCHAHGDDAVETVLDIWEKLFATSPRLDPRPRLEHVGAMTPAQFRRAADLGVTVSVFVDHLYYWGDLLVDELFGPERGAVWAAAGSAAAAGLRFSFHNDVPVTPEEPLRNLSVAATRRSRSGRVHGPEERLPMTLALLGHGPHAAWQLFSEDEVGSLAPGRFADLVVLSADPLAVEPEAVAGLDVLATVLEGRQVHGDLL